MGFAGEGGRGRVVVLLREYMASGGFLCRSSYIRPAFFRRISINFGVVCVIFQGCSIELVF